MEAISVQSQHDRMDICDGHPVQMGDGILTGASSPGPGNWLEVLPSQKKCESLE